MNKYLSGLFLVVLTSLTSLTAHDGCATYDYIIVGNGTAGAVLARKLTDDHKTKVLVLEAYINQDTNPMVLDVSGAGLLENLTVLTYDPEFAQTYSLPGFFPLQGFIYSEGKGWGGSSKHNYLQVIRGTPDIYDSWAAASGNPLWKYKNALPLMKALENYTPCDTVANPAQRGKNGPISVTQAIPVTSDPFAIVFAAGTGAGFIPDINDPTEKSTTGHFNLGFSAYQFFATPGKTCGSVVHRSFSSNSFLPPSIVSPEGEGKGGRLLRIESNAHVSRVLFDGINAEGVEFIFGDRPEKVLKAYGKKIILCAGSVNSPAILQRSGIGDPKVLEPLGITVLVDNPNVGANLLDQYGASAIVAATTTVIPFLQGFVNASGIPAPDNYPNDDVRRLQFDVASAGPGLSEVVCFILEPKSRGSIQIISANPFDPPRVDLNPYSDGSFTVNGTDANLIVTAFKLVEKSFPGLVLYPPAFDFTSDALLFNAAQQSNSFIAESHIVSTTRMAKSIQDGVVDRNLHVFGVENLMVVDAGVIPTLPNGNICYGVYVVALGAAKILGVPTPPAR